MFMNGIALEATESCYSPTSPPPYMAGAATIDVDPETGRHYPFLKYDAVIDCGTVINPSLARVQAEGGIVQAIGMALTETFSIRRRDGCRIILSCSTACRRVSMWGRSSVELRTEL